jgi:hypothetical protein
MLSVPIIWYVLHTGKPMKIKDPQILSSTHIQQFLDFIMASHSLTIGEYFPQIDVNKSFFMLAATGLGKTVALPIYLLYLLVKKLEDNTSFIKIVEMPTVWVVMPKVTIAESEAHHLNELYTMFLLSLVAPLDPKKPILKSTKLENSDSVLFGYRTSKESKHTTAPIQFITTGVLPLISYSNELDPKLNSVIIDEAHVTLEATEDMEIGITFLKKQGVIVNFMSATVETADLEERLGTTIIKADKARHKNFYHNTGKPLLACIEDIIACTLINFDTNSQYYPQLTGNGQDKNWKESVITGTKCFSDNKENPTRSSGLLVTINSQQGKKSDSKDVEQKIHRLCKVHGIEVLVFSSKINKDAKLKRLFDQAFDRIKKCNLKYVIIATSVIEMGITWETLDYVVTMDSEYENIDVDGHQILMTVPLGTNALKQRIGRVGRKRPGCGYITKEFGTYYTDMSDEELNGNGLKNQPISFPLSRVKPMKLTYLLRIQGITTYEEIKKYLIEYRFPSLQTPAEIGNAIYKIQTALYKYHMPVTIPISIAGQNQAMFLSERWIGDAGYPFILEGFKCLFGDFEEKDKRDTPKSRLQKYDMFIAWNFMAIVIKFPQVNFLRVDPKTNTKATTIDFDKSVRHGRAIVKDAIVEKHGFGFNQDRIYWVNNRVSELADVSALVANPLRISIDFEDNSKIIYTGGYTLSVNLDKLTMGKFYEAYSLHFKELLKVVKKAGLDELLIKYLSGGQMFDEYCEDDIPGEWDIYMEPKNSLAVLFSDDIHLVDSTGKDLGTSKNLTLNLIKIITKIHGAKVTKLTPANEFQTLWNFEAEYQSQTITGMLNQEYHYCQFEKDWEYYAFLTPRTKGKNKDTEIVWGLDYFVYDWK